jgi:ABC-type transport system involved in multi-copper enzyme maturation permease subunit
VRGEQLNRESAQMLDPEQMRRANEELLTNFYDPSVGLHLSKAPAVTLMMLIGTIWLTPGLIALVAFDAIAADLQYRSVRYWTVRMHRSAFFVGKVLGVFSLVALMTFLIHFLAWGIAIVRGVSPFGATLGWGMQLWATTLPITLAWSSMAVFLSSLSKTPMLALLFTFATNFILWLCYIIGKAGKYDWLTYVYPNRFDIYLLSPASDRIGIGLVGCAAFAAVFIGSGVAIFQRRDV